MTPEISGNVTAGFSIAGVSQPFLISAIDADGNFIVDTGAPTLTASVSGVSAGSGIAVAAPTGTNPNEFTLSSTSSGTATLAITATRLSTLAGSALTANVLLTVVPHMSSIVGTPGARACKTELARVRA